MGPYPPSRGFRTGSTTPAATAEGFQVSLYEVIGQAGDSLAVVERIWGRGRGSGAEGQMRVYTVYRFNPDGKIGKRQSFTTREEAAAALREPL